ncbi:MAG: rubrerythrin family protein [Candidatus Heimdallarchaeota archaeon]|nr:MAG: rubrerythrin family protein [Candidatus Heimdallarchaeota archaeon]
MGKTEENLMAAFAGESQANRKYLAYAKKAEKDGFPQVGRLFRAVAHAETVHAHSHLHLYGGIKTTLENIKAAIEGEHYEFTKMYPEFLEDAKEETQKAAERTFDFANQVEKIHHELYSRALQAIEDGKDLPEKTMYVCEVCGYTVEDGIPDKCPICNTSHERFVKIE